MKRFIVCLSVLVLILGFGAVATAAPTTFTFDSLYPGNGAAAISSYMTSAYGAAVTVTGREPEAEGSWLFPGLLGGSGDRYIESEPSGAHRIQINFATPITSLVTFDWGTYVDAFNAEYSLDGTNFTPFFHVDAEQPEWWQWWIDGVTKGQKSFDFGSLQVTALRFHDSGAGEVGIDNLVVNKATVPEPMSLLLLGLGLLGLGVARRKK